MDPEIKSALFRIFPFAIVLLVVAIRLRQNKIDAASLDLVKPISWKRYLLCTLGFLAFILLTEWTLFQFGLLETDRWNHPLLSSVLRITGAVIIAPIAEELLFRGFILNLLRKKTNVHLAIFLQAILFVLLHNFAYENTLSSHIGIGQSFVDACLFGYARQYTKSLYTPMTMHMTGNLIATLERFVI